MSLEKTTEQNSRSLKKIFSVLRTDRRLLESRGRLSKNTEFTLKSGKVKVINDLSIGPFAIALRIQPTFFDRIRHKLPLPETSVDTGLGSSCIKLEKGDLAAVRVVFNTNVANDEYSFTLSIGTRKGYERRGYGTLLFTLIEDSVRSAIETFPEKFAEKRVVIEFTDHSVSLGAEEPIWGGPPRTHFSQKRGWSKQVGERLGYQYEEADMCYRKVIQG